MNPEEILAMLGQANASLRASITERDGRIADAQGEDPRTDTRVAADGRGTATIHSVPAAGGNNASTRDAA